VQRDICWKLLSFEAKEPEKRLSYVLDAEEDYSAIWKNELETDAKWLVRGADSLGGVGDALFREGGSFARA